MFAMIGILYESPEWSIYKLVAELENRGHIVSLLDMEDTSNESLIFSCNLLVNRVFASAGFRGHWLSLKRTPHIIKEAARQGIPLLNPACSHLFETSKEATMQTLGRAGLCDPRVYACDLPQRLDVEGFVYPCILKPNCGGRATYTTIARTPMQARLFLETVPDIPFITEEYIQPEKGYITRVEVIGYECALVQKRSIASDGLSSYHLGSQYEQYHRPDATLLKSCEKAARTLSIELGSFDIIEKGGQYYFIDANAASNVSEDCTELFNFDLMSVYAQYITERYRG